MVKAKTSSKQKKSSENTPKYKLKKGVELTPYSPRQEILQGDLVARAILECLLNNDPKGVIEAISTYLEVLNKEKSAKRVNLPKSTMYHSLKMKNPTIKTLAKLMHTTRLDTAKDVTRRK